MATNKSPRELAKESKIKILFIDIYLNCNSKDTINKTDKGLLVTSVINRKNHNNVNNNVSSLSLRDFIG